ncbi:ParA family protein [Vibrio sp. R78045]|uniref:ParA family protein n=1 Tax=Vibrio sp. R78045 TaxID=3093868 RepID=UPI0036F373C9
MDLNITTLKKLESFAKGASDLLEERKDLNPKRVRTFERPEAVEYLKTDYRTIEKYCADLNIDPRQKANDLYEPTPWQLTINDLYKIREALPETTILKKKLLASMPRMKAKGCQIIVVQNQKGGVAKTLTTITLATGTATEYHQQYRVAIIDMDGQSTLSTYQPNLTSSKRTTIGDLLPLDPKSNEYIKTVKNAISDTTIPNLKIIPADQSDRDVEATFHEGVHEGTITNPYKRLKSIIDAIKSDFDVIYIDTPPSLNFASINAYFAATSVLFPFGASQNDTDATCQYLTYLPSIYRLLIKEGHNGYDFMKMLITNYEESYSSQEVMSELKEYFPLELLPTKFNKSEAIKVCAKERNSIYDISKSCYPGTKSTFNKAKLNTNALLSEVMDEITKVWKNI